MATSDLFPGFQSHWLDTSVGQIFARSGGSGPPLLLIHGFPQTHVEWHRIAPELAKTHTLILPDLPGYGWSVAPEGGSQHYPYAKRDMAKILIEVMEQLGHVRFAVIGHDRGARVSYRMALDHPGRVERLALLDIVPTITMWERIRASPSPKTEHWLFLSGPQGQPEAEIGKDPTAYLEQKLALWTKAGTLTAYDPRARQHYRDFFNDPSRIHACCEDYRAGATVDLAADEVDKAAGKTIGVPVHVVWGSAGIPSEGASPLDAWKLFAPKATGVAVDSGHFIPEENPAGTLAALKPFLAV
ncbi:alpha/beta hydrolase [Phreatobacter aquaticus]|uniref:Alpha/beta hydrolase n=1 Tax=Phreatobacter aquaticus TaxID=2570229 RepID=A0A4D7QKY5_9HYPH|nr:alpha/beta hydrolase [Phreatobacter aquaticus]QCK86016.1 alpha/beta hydrolase [Phreatobacter aquaticus]